MEGALRASIQGLELADQARKRQGWNRQSAAWAQTALTTVSCLKLFWRRERLSREVFIHICEAIGLDWEKVADDRPKQTAIADWGEAPELTFFCGRTEELQTLESWITIDRCKVVILLGMGGMGKTTLAVQLADRLLDQFEFVVWRSLRNAPAPTALMTNVLQCLGEVVSSEENLLPRLMTFLRQHRCLLVLDNAESILNAEGDYEPGYEPYGELIRCVGEERHSSCLLLTSREQVREITRLAAERVRSLRLPGLPVEAGQQILERGGAPATSLETCQVIVEHYAGNPLALKIAAAGIRDLMCGDTTEFVKGLQQGRFVFGDLHDLLARQFDRLLPEEQDILYWLAIAREPLSLDELKQDLLLPESRWKLTEALELLKRRSLLETGQSGMTLQPAVMEYVTHRLIEQGCTEIKSSRLTLFCTHALIKATARDDVREAQKRLILQPLIERLQSTYETTAALQNVLLRHLEALRGKPPIKTGYVAGNILNILIALQVDLTNLDGSHLTIWQADLRGATLQGADFTGANLKRSRFTEPFSNVLCVAFSPDGRTLVKSDDRGWISVWNVASDQPLLSFRAHEHWIFALAFSPDGKRLASGGLDCLIKLWDLTTGQCLRTIQEHSEGVAAIAFSPDGTLLASGSSDQTIKLFDVQTGDCVHTLNDHQGIVRSVTFSAGKINASGTQTTLVSASLDSTVKLWDVSTGQCFKTLTAPVALHSVTVLQINDSPLIAAAGDDGNLYWWDISTEALSTLTLAGDSFARETTLSRIALTHQRTWSLVSNSDEALLISAGDDALIKLWHLPTQRCLKVLTGHSDRIWSLAISPDKKTLVSGSDDQTVRLWDLETGQCLRILQGYHNHTVPISFSQTQLLTFSADQQLRVWDLATDRCIKALYFPAKAALHVMLSPDHKTLAIGNTDYTIRLYHFENGALWKTLSGHLAWVREVAFSPDDMLLASASGDHTIKLWRIATGDCFSTLTGHTSPIRSVAFHPNGKLLASGSWDRTVKLWDVERGICLKTLADHTGQVRQVIFTPNGQYLISCGQDHTIRVWHLDRGSCTVLNAHAAAVEAIACSPNSELLASASLDGTIGLWTLKDRVCLQTLTATVEPNTKLLFNTEGNWLAIACENATCVLWNVQTIHSPQNPRILQVPRPYEGMKITHTTELTDAQRATLKALGAQEDEIST
jgi:WD40 repeat protein